MCRDGRHSCFGIQSVLYFPGLFLLCPLHPHLRHRQFHASSRNILCVGYNVECYLDVQCASKQWCRGLFRLVRVNQWSSLTETSTKITLLISGLLSLTIGDIRYLLVSGLLPLFDWSASTTTNHAYNRSLDLASALHYCRCRGSVTGHCLVASSVASSVASLGQWPTAVWPGGQELLTLGRRMEFNILLTLIFIFDYNI